MTGVTWVGHVVAPGVEPRPRGSLDPPPSHPFLWWVGQEADPGVEPPPPGVPGPTPLSPVGSDPGSPDLTLDPLDTLGLTMSFVVRTQDHTDVMHLACENRQLDFRCGFVGGVVRSALGAMAGAAGGGPSTSVHTGKLSKEFWARENAMGSDAFAF